MTQVVLGVLSAIMSKQAIHGIVVLLYEPLEISSDTSAFFTSVRALASEDILISAICRSYTSSERGCQADVIRIDSSTRGNSLLYFRILC